MSVSASITSGGNDSSGCELRTTTNKKVRRFPESESIPQSEESEEDSERFNSLACVDSIPDDIIAVDILTQPITIYSTPSHNRGSLNGSSNNTKSRSVGPCSPNNSSSESSTFSTVHKENPRVTLRKNLASTPTGIPVRKNGSFAFGYRSQSAFSLLQPQTAHSGHHQLKTRLGMPCPAKKQNKWDAVMSKIAETKNKAINVRDVKSRVFSAVKVMTNSAPIVPTNNIPNNRKETTNQCNNRKSSFNFGNSTKFRHRHLLLHENDHFSSQSSTLSVSDSSSLDEHHLRGSRVPQRLPALPRVKKDGMPLKSRRQMSDLSSASDYSTHHPQTGDHQPPPPRRKPRPTVTRVAPAKSHSSLITPTLASNNEKNNLGNGHTTVNKTKRFTTIAVSSGPNFASTRPPLSSARNVVPTTNGPGNIKTSHPLKPLRDRNRMAPIGKTMEPAMANVSLPRSNGGHQNGGLGELISDERDASDGDVTIVPVKVVGSGSRLQCDSATQVCVTPLFGNGRLIEEMALSEDSESATSTTSLNNNNNNSRRNTNQHHQSQNAVILENTSLKEEINQMTLMIQQLQGQVNLLNANYEKQKALIGSAKADIAGSNSRFLVMSLVAQHCDLQKSLIAERLSTVEDRCLVNEQEKNTKRELCSKFQEDRNSHKEQIASLTKNYESEIAELEEYYEDRLSRVKDTNDAIMADLRRIHEEDMQRLEANYRSELEVMKLRHEENLADQIKKTPGDILHKEIHSLQVVVEIRNQEIKDLRHDLLESHVKIEALTLTNEQNKALSARVEDLEAQLEKTRHDKNKILEKFNTMETSMTQVVTENDRLHLYTEELNWRIETLKSDDESEDESGDSSAATRSPSNSFLLVCSNGTSFEVRRQPQS